MTLAPDIDQEQLQEISRSFLAGLEIDVEAVCWLSGSIIEGLGTSTSDIDLFVALPESAQNLQSGLSLTLYGADRGVYAAIENGQRFDVEFWPTSSIRILASKLAALPVDDPEKNNLHYLNYWESEFVHRILVGIPLQNEDAFVSLKSLFDARVFSRFLLDTAIRYADSSFEDTVGMLELEDLRSAALRARDTVGYSVDALIHSHGRTNDKKKFRLNKLCRLVEEVGRYRLWLDRYWEIESRIPKGSGQQRAYSESALRFSSELIEHAQKIVNERA